MFPSFRSSENPDSLAINLPNNLRARPVDCVGMESVLISRIVVGSTAIVTAGVSFSEVVGLHIQIVYSEPFPIDLIKVIRLQHCTTDNADSWCSLDHELDMTKHHVPVGLDQRSITLLGHSESNTIAVEGGVSNWFEVGGRTLGEVVRD